MSNKRSRAAFDEADGPPSHAPFALYGTPLPAYDPDARDDGSYVPVWKQEVTDERGRKRLHGAFTGGWSAGYFNTVGSKEGWTPSTFVSSRNKRADGEKKDGGQRVEDFMDEEDLAERAESQRLETQGAFAGLGASGSAGNGGGMFADLFRATGETMGVKLLQRMGWRQGQGIGPKVRRKAKGDEKGAAHLFAPDNSCMIGFRRKTDRKGMGFAGEEKLGPSQDTNELDGEDDSDRDARILNSKSKVLVKPKQKLKKNGLGVGVLNDTGSDDEDAYDMGPKISYNRIIGGDKKKRRGGLLSTNANPALQRPASTTSKKLIQRNTTLAGFRKCHDGRLPLDGFVLSAVPLAILQVNTYPPPRVPEGWKPSRLSNVTGSETSNTTYQSTADAAKISTLDSKSRAALLGEQQLPGKSVFDFLTPSARDRLAAASGRTDLPAALGEKAPAGFEASEAEKRRTLWDLVPELDKQTAAAALQRGISGWMPYAEDEAKRERYRYFLALRAGQESNLPERGRDVSTDEWAKELREFAQAAEVFKPISGLMATRFTTSTSGGPRLATDAPDFSSNESKREDDPAEKAARLGMYGPLTRSKLPFYPTRLLCKRFNVKPPATVGVDMQAGGADVDVNGGYASGSSASRRDVVSQASLDSMMRDANFAPVGGRGFVSAGTEGGDGPSAPTLVSQKVPEVNTEQNEALEGQKAGEAVFKAIFGSDDDDDDD